AWDGTGWSTDGIVILQHDTAAATLTVAISHLSEFAFFAASVPTNLDPDDEPRQLFLPAVMSGASHPADAADCTDQAPDGDPSAPSTDNAGAESLDLQSEAPPSIEAADVVPVLYLPVVGR
ncbi:MAG TPA: hypothetical protein GX400_02340, partial [Chloroflexi bacterium]|nr:hypothetical protein [Chloroflexota bacterium]